MTSISSTSSPCCPGARPARRAARSAGSLIRSATLAAGLCLGGMAAPAWSASVGYLATDLADTTVGQDLWRIDYTVQGPLALFEGVNLLFSAETFADIALLGNTAPTPLATAPVVQPDAGLSSDGLLTLTALAPLDAAFKGAVGVSLVWKGGPAGPGAQPFEWLDESFNVIETGATTPVPEPGAAWLALGGLLAVGWGLARDRRGRPPSLRLATAPHPQSRSAAPVPGPA